MMPLVCSNIWRGTIYSDTGHNAQVATLIIRRMGCIYSLYFSIQTLL